MGRAIAHRGPDDEQYYDDGYLSLVFRRLAVVDIKGGRQPVFNEARDALLVANGEIYNHLELKASLRHRHRFATDSDCEAFLHGYEEWGLKAIERCRGMFAMALWEIQERRLTLFRDRLGIKPLYVCPLPDGVLFGSELKGLLAHPECPRIVEEAAVLGNPIDSARTPTYLRGVEHLAPASYAVFAPDTGYRQGTYWHLDSHLATAPYGMRKEAYVDALHDLIVDATHEHLQADSAVGLHLSGGLDSTLLAGIVARVAKDTPCVSIVERTSYLAGDVGSAKATTEKLGLPWYPVLYDYRQLVGEMHFDLKWLERAVWMMDSPRFDLEWVMKERLTATLLGRRPDVKAFLIGQGADEFSGGYSSRLDSPRASWAKYIAEEIDPWIRDLNNASPARAAGPDRQQLNRLTASDRDLGPYHHAMRLFMRQLNHHNLWHEDRSSAWLGAEARLPFLDHRIVELLASIPSALHESLFHNKAILRACMRRTLPAYDIGRPKVGFCMTDDTRSLDIIVHSMAVAAAPGFLEKYAGMLDHEPLDERLAEMMRRVINHEPGFYTDSYALLQIMSRVIFQHQVQTGPMPELEAGHRAPGSLPIVQGNDWAMLEQSLRMQPCINVTWQHSDIPRLPPDTEIIREQLTTANVRYSLTREDTVFAMIELTQSSRWLSSFMCNLGKGVAVGYTVGDWLEEFQLDGTEFIQILDILHQCGFLTTPDSRLSEYAVQLDPGATVLRDAGETGPRLPPRSPASNAIS